MWASFSGRTGIWMVGAGLSLGVACAGKSDPPPQGSGAGATGGRGFTTGATSGSSGTGGGSAGRGGTGGKAGSSNQGGEGGEVMTDPGGPIVEVTSPPALAAPGDGDVLVESEIDVTCEVRASSGGEAVDPSTVVIQLLDADDAVVDEVVAAPTGEPNEYSARVILDKIEENGVVGFTCIAADTTIPPLTGIDTVHSFVDHGPDIALVAPAEMSVYPLASVTFEFTVTEAPVASRDSGADVDSVTLTVDQVDVPVGNPDADGNYQVAAELSNTDLFSAEAGPVAFTIEARTARGGVRVLSSSFILDDEGPTITIESPGQGSVVGSRIPVRFTVTDDYSAVDPDSVVVSIAGVTSRFDGGPNWDHSGDSYTCFVDSSATGRSDFQATISVGARDEAGNDALAETRLVYLDNHPPIVDLIPPNVRERRRVTGGYECSKSFDPVGLWAPEDLQQIPNHFFPRVLIWEKTNDFGQQYLHLSGTDDSTAHLFFNPTPGEPVLVDNDEDPECDEVAAAILTSNAGVVLDAIESKGDSWWGIGDEATPPPFDACGPPMSPTAEPPQRQCIGETSDLARVIEHEMIMLDTSEHPAVIYAAGVDPSGGGLECTGTDWEMGTLANGEGWLCFAARIVDNAGNVGVSRPIRLCHDNPNTVAVPACVNDTNGMTAPSCMDSCTSPAVFDNVMVDRIN